MQQTVTMSNEQAAAFAAQLLPATIKAYIAANRQDYEAWLKERQQAGGGDKAQ